MGMTMVRTRRYYPAGSKPKVTYSDEYIEECEKNGIRVNDNAQYEIIYDNTWVYDMDNERITTEQIDAYEDCLLDVFSRPRWYLDNLDRLKEFRVNWNRYGSYNTVKRPPVFNPNKNLVTLAIKGGSVYVIEDDRSNNSNV